MPSRVSTSTCRAFTFSLASSESLMAVVVPASTCLVFLVAIDEAQPTSANSPTPTREPVATANLDFMKYRPFPNV